VASSGVDVNRNVQQIIDRSDWRRKLLTDYTATADRLTTAYSRTLPRLRDSAGLFTQRLTDWQNANDGELPSASVVRNLTEFQQLLLNVETEMKDFAAIVRNEAGTIQESAILTGSDAAAQMAQDFAGNMATVVEGMWNRPAPETLQAVINYVDGAAYREKSSAFGVNAAQSIADTILTGVAQGKNPRTIAGIMSNWFSVPYAWAENNVRTVQIYGFRDANHESYLQNPDVLNGWIWIASLGDPRTCMSCVSKHGSKHDLSETLNDHDSGRCTPAPWVKGTTWPDLIITGPNWFESQPESYQRQQMGGALFNAWNAGAIGWTEMSQVYHSDIYGDMLRETSVIGVLGSDAPQYYVRNQKPA
jgi:hypothetical protein